LLSVIGLEWLLRILGIILKKYLGLDVRKYIPLTAGLIASIAIGMSNLNMLNIALTESPYWTNDYGLYGYQYGAKQLFVDTFPKYLANPNNRILLTSSWANGADNFVRYFYDSETQARVPLAGVETYINFKTEIRSGDLFVITRGELDKVINSKKFKEPIIENIVNYPDGTPGFYFVRLAYIENVDDVFNAQEIERKKLVESEITIDGEPAKIAYSILDAGQPNDIFDGDFNTLMRGMEANPFIIEISFPSARSLSGIDAIFAHMDLKMKVSIYVEGESEPRVFEITSTGVNGDPQVQLLFDGSPYQVLKMRIEILSLSAGERANIHIRELKFIP
jgi:hypothetical protein